MSGIGNIQFAHVEMKERFVNIANVSLENFPYAIDLKVTYPLTLLQEGSKLPHSCLVV